MSGGPSGAGLFTSSQRGAAAGPTPPVMAALNAGATLAIPGPAAGLIRLFDRIQVFAAVSGAWTSSLVLRDAGAVDWYLGLVTTGTGSVPTSLVGAVVPLATGEELRITNTSAVNTLVTYVYRDVPAATITPIRLSLTAVAQDVIPAAPAGFFRRLYRAAEMPATVESTVARAIFANPDTITHSPEWTIAGAVFTRGSQTLTTAVSATYGSSLRASISTDALQLRVTTVPVTANPVFVGAYETLRG